MMAMFHTSQTVIANSTKGIWLPIQHERYGMAAGDQSGHVIRQRLSCEPSGSQIGHLDASTAGYT